jgi:hypothetical protein
MDFIKKVIFGQPQETDIPKEKVGEVKHEIGSQYKMSETVVNTSVIPETKVTKQVKTY